MDTPPQLRCVECDRVLDYPARLDDPARLGDWGVLFCSDACAAATVTGLPLEDCHDVAVPILYNLDTLYGGISSQLLLSHPSERVQSALVWLTVVRFWGSPLVLRLRLDPSANCVRTTLHGIELDTSPPAFQRARRCAKFLLDLPLRGRPIGSTLLNEQQFRRGVDRALAELRAEAKRISRGELAIRNGISTSTFNTYAREYGVNVPRR